MQHQIRRYYSRKLQYNLGCFYSKLSRLETIWDTLFHMFIKHIVFTFVLHLKESSTVLPADRWGTRLWYKGIIYYQSQSLIRPLAAVFLHR